MSQPENLNQSPPSPASEFSHGKVLALLALLTAGAFVVHGYHPGVEDAEIYLPGVEKILHPELFRFNAEFFNSHAHLTLFPNFIALLVRTTHLSLSAVLLLCEFASIFLLLLASWELSGELFCNPISQWCGVATVAALLTLPVAGTSLYIIDQYTNPRNFAAFAAVLAVTSLLRKKYLITGLWLIFAAAMHPLMSAFALSFCVLLSVMSMKRAPVALVVSLLPIEFSFHSPSNAYHQAAMYHPFHYILNWEWYEWLGIIAPVALLWWFARIAKSERLSNLELMCRAMIVYDCVYFTAGLIVSIPARFGSLARLQPLRSLHLLYVLLFLIIGSLIGEFILKNQIWRWAVFFVPLCAGMFIAQRALFPSTPQIEWTLNSSKNDWAQAFVWIRENTPPDALFALDPLHMQIPGEDSHGFRAIAERSMLADALKDSGAVTMFPPLAEEWYSQIQAQNGWQHFQLKDFDHLKTRYGINWIVVQKPVEGISCPFKNTSVLVCELGR